MAHENKRSKVFGSNSATIEAIVLLGSPTAERKSYNNDSQNEQKTYKKQINTHRFKHGNN